MSIRLLILLALIPFLSSIHRAESPKEPEQGSQSYSSELSREPSSAHSCKVKLYDIGQEITGVGSSKVDAYKQAATLCFEKRLAFFEAKRGKVNREFGTAVINSCANINCAN